MSGNAVGLQSFTMVEAFCNYYNDLSTQRDIELHVDNTDLSVIVQLEGDGLLHVHGTTSRAAGNDGSQARRRRLVVVGRLE